jgi:hypothetical protein
VNTRFNDVESLLLLLLLLLLRASILAPTLKVPNRSCSGFAVPNQLCCCQFDPPAWCRPTIEDILRLPIVKKHLQVGRRRLKASKPILKAPVVSALETIMS